jgi:hypothetical protein
MKISDKLSKASDSIEVTKIDNGYMVEVRGRTLEDDWDGAKLYASTLAEVDTLINEWDEMERD